METFRQNRTTASPAISEGPGDGLEVVFVENVYDPDPADEHYETTVLYLIRDHGELRIETDHWTMGLFPLDTSRRGSARRHAVKVFHIPCAEVSEKRQGADLSAAP